MTKCIDLLRSEIADLSEDELKEVREMVQNRQGELMAKGIDSETAAAQAGADVASMQRAAAALARREAAQNFTVRTGAIDYIRTFWKDKPWEGLLALVYGSPLNRFGSRGSVYAAQSAQWRRVEAGVFEDLKKAGLWDIVRRGEMDRDIWRAMWSINDPERLGKLPQQAVDAAKILHQWQETARVEANRHGAWIGLDPTYVIKRSHDADKIDSAGFEQWYADVLPQADLERMFPQGAPKDLKGWFEEFYTNVTTGVRPEGPQTYTGERMAAFSGPANLAKKLSHERVLHLKSADAEFDYNTKYGRGNLRESYIAGLHRMSEATGLMQVLGTNPEYNVKAIAAAIRADLSRTDKKLLDKFDEKMRGAGYGKRLENAVKEVTGDTRRVVRGRMATFGAGLRTVNTFSGLGSAVLSAITDVPIRASALRFQGQNYLSALADGVVAPIKAIVRILPTDERNATLAAMGHISDVALGNMAARFSPDDSIPGRLQKATNTFFKWNLLGAWTDEMRRSALEAMGRFFGELHQTAFGAMSERSSRTLERFRIGEKEWNVIRKGLHVESTGEKFLTPQAVRELDPEEFSGLAGAGLQGELFKSAKPTQRTRILENTREDMASRLQQLYADEVNAAVVSPDARALATMRQGTQAGTPMGEALRHFFQFKSFGIGIFQRAFMREFYGYDYGRGAGRLGMSEISGLGVMMAGGLGFGYMAMSMKDALKGKKPRPLDDKKTWMAAAAQGGAFGIYGDFLFSEANRYGTSAVATVAGPTVGKAEALFKLYNSAKSGDDVAAQSLRFVMSNVPNLFYTKMVVDYLFMYELQEAMNPGYLRRMERKTEQETGAQWWLRPSEVVNR